MKKILVILLCFQFYTQSYAQNTINEYSNLECDNSTPIHLPLEAKTTKSSASTVFYDHQDQFSYWYRIVLDSASSFSAKIKPINEGDVYTIFTYKHKQGDFCNKVFRGKIKPINTNRLTANKKESTSSIVTEVTITSEKAATYYICVLNVSPSNCGHHMELINLSDTVRVKAIHFPCEEPEEEILAKKSGSSEIQSPNLSNLMNATVKLKDQLDTTKKIDARLLIKDELTGNEVEIDFAKQNTFNLRIERDKAYKVECIAMGYKRFDHSIVISDYMASDSNDFTIFLKPLQTGEKFKMEHIYFYPNTYALKKSAYQEMDYLSNMLTNNPDAKIELQGHTNGNHRVRKNRAYKKRGPEWNFEGSMKKLSIHRAEAIKKYLVEKGITAQRIVTKGYGGDHMIIPNARSMEAIQKNVRVEVLLL